jgi:hypothetical protein
MSADPLRAAQIERRLAEWYNRNPRAAADVCDGVIDRSGNLLGWLRDAALALQTPEGK